VRPSEITAIVLAALIGIGGAVAGIVVLLTADGGKPWFYWIAPLLSLGFAGLLVNLAVGYYVKVGRVELKGRPRSE
jgi:hypothetical protein